LPLVEAHRAPVPSELAVLLADRGELPIAEQVVEVTLVRLEERLPLFRRALRFLRPHPGGAAGHHRHQASRHGDRTRARIVPHTHLHCVRESKRYHPRQSTYPEIAPRSPG